MAAALMVSKAGVPREIVARVLNHTDRDVTAIYVHASYDEPKRKPGCPLVLPKAKPMK